MARPRFPLTAAVEQSITAYARAGGFPDVAAEAAGVPLDAYRDWMRRGEAPRAPATYRAFALAVRQACAQGRLAAEIAVRDRRPVDWLRYGPGRDTPRLPGWGAAVRPIVAPAEEGAVLAGVLQEMMHQVIRILGPWPDARAAVAAVLNNGSHRRS